MKSEWRVYSNPIPTDKGLKIYYGVYRLKDVDKIDEGGNRETSGNMCETYLEARARADYMNSKEDPEEVLKDGIERG